MKTLVLTATAAVALAAAVGSQAGSATLKTKICGQIKHGPRATYTNPVIGKKLRGTTWTVFSTGVQCSLAMKQARPILKWWAKAKVGDRSYSANGFTCNKEADRYGKSGSTGCTYSGLRNIELMMTGKYTIPQLKKLFYIR